MFKASTLEAREQKGPKLSARNGHPQEELDLLLAVLRGEAEAERDFVRRFVPLIEHCVRRFSRKRAPWVTEEDIRDIMGEVWVSLWEKNKLRLRRFDPSRRIRVSTWIGLLARNKTIDWLRAQQDPMVGQNRVSFDIEPRSTAPVPAEEVEWREHWRLTRRAMGELSREERRFMRAWYLEDWDSRELARRLGIAVATVYSRRFKIVQKLARSIERMEQQPDPPVRH